MKKIIFPAIFSILALTACEDIVDIELNDEDRGFYAVEAKITTLDEPWVQVNKALPANAKEELPGVSNALVTISDDAAPANTLVLTESNEMPGLYQVPEGSSFPGVINRTYTITIETEDATLTASDRLEPVEPIDSIKIFPSMRGDQRFLAIFTYGAETPGAGNYYKWDIYINDTLLHEAEYLFFASDELVDGNYVDGLEIFTDFHDPNDKDASKLKYMDEVVVYQNSITKFTYEYFMQLLNQSFTGNMFSVPPANIPSNFVSSNKKDVLGVFTAHDVSVSNRVLIDDDIINEIRE